MKETKQLSDEAGAIERHTGSDSTTLEGGTLLQLPSGSRPSPLVQPWKSFWPPAPGSDSYLRLIAENPTIFTWQFDMTRPFDRPWRLWTGAAPAEGGGSVQDPRSPSAACSHDSILALDYGNTQKMRDELDEQFRNLALPKVFPKSFNHLAPLELYQKEKPYKCQLPEACFPGLKMHNLVSQSYHVGIADVTGHEDMFSLAISGFEFATCPISIEEWSDDSVSAQYLPGLARWLKQCTGCRDVFCYAYNFRHHDAAQGSDVSPKYEFKLPFFRAHCDASEETCRARLQLYFPERYAELTKGRIRFVNIWRPLSASPILDCPLALCDFRTINPEDLVPMDLVYPHFVDEAYEVRYNPSHRWLYKKEMGPDDVIIFKLYDNLRSEATVCPHSAFVDPSAPRDTPKRASIEVKAILIG